MEVKTSAKLRQVEVGEDSCSMHGGKVRGGKYSFAQSCDYHVRIVDLIYQRDVVLHRIDVTPLLAVTFRMRHFSNSIEIESLLFY